MKRIGFPGCFSNIYMDKLIDSDSIKEFRRLIEESADIVLTCHVRPDGDAIGSTLGMMHLLRALGKNVTVIIPDKAPGNLSLLPGFKEMGVYTCHPEFCKKTVESISTLRRVRIPLRLSYREQLAARCSSTIIRNPTTLRI